MQLALAGIGKIAIDQHIPALHASSDWQLAATLSRRGNTPGVPAYADFAQLRHAHPEVTAISLCLPPVPRFALAQQAIEAGLHVMLEKPPGASLSEVLTLERLAKAKGVTLYASWHSREARAVARAKAALAGQDIIGGRITWREDVQHWHPGQDWIFEPGGMGVFDPGINALSILTEILPQPVHLIDAALDVPANRQTPIAARLQLSHNISADLDFRQKGPQSWDIEIQTAQDRITLRMGGNQLEINGATVEADASITGEYPGLYAHFATLVRQGRSDVDLSPMVLVADALSLGHRNHVEDFHFDPTP